MPLSSIYRLQRDIGMVKVTGALEISRVKLRIVLVGETFERS